ncbi:hypothetical protein DDZ18_10065 [Marinicauda salina]|uniref:Uncharacterized protein n=1 Tax=Marinicauda salina TaxID=2135793 RepID=A0A2U2BSQ2_9PROT|nr:hypothetical protein [Marinicauda salina]PWE17039.1 hypothetical protein DDZ18_10065 [Marinicauda salina]
MGAFQGLAYAILRVVALVQGLNAAVHTFNGVLIAIAESVGPSPAPAWAGAPPAWFSYLAYSVPLLVMSLLVWRYAKPLSARVVGDAEQSDSAISVSGDQVAMIAFAALGLYFLLLGLPSVLADIATWIYMSQQPGDDPTRTIVLGEGDKYVRVVIGFLLLFGAIRLKPLLKALREAGISKIEDAPAEKSDPPN